MVLAEVAGLGAELTHSEALHITLHISPQQGIEQHSQLLLAHLLHEHNV